MVSKAMIMAAGVGSRLMPMTSDIPKPMIPVANRPLMENTVNLLMELFPNSDKKIVGYPCMYDAMKGNLIREKLFRTTRLVKFFPLRKVMKV